ncbi:DUF2147 domain-containing protein [Bradyrhizobium canariense]|uniref:Uncharacterized conserved protein, DUF2147 family n=1 Tax=Bradyrhizobium canariense TaxID=255045 RepID=A0A1H1QAC4_9BRAD|nr:DUF2147 domain-containing protein [Bradyrhizobium canariense]SDS20471.1 Uncharacterized conserved protein, DUF2147 family [Bradyrhizobium canariense]
MKRLLALAAFLLASTAAQAQYTFDYGGRTIRIDPDRGTVSIPGVYDNTGRRKRAHKDQDNDHPRKQAPQQAKVDPQAPAPAPAQTDPAPAPSVPPTNVLPEPSNTTADVTPADNSASPPPPASAPVPQVQQEATQPASPAPAPVIATAPPALPMQSQQTPAPATPTIQSANSPLGLWLTEEKEGKIRIEQCGANLCGYSVDTKSNQNGEQVLINMKPGNDSKWSGRILDPNTGSTYDSTIALKGPDSLRVQGCAFGGMFCGGQTWSRLN